jgi:hypothetical protein
MDGTNHATPDTENTLCKIKDWRSKKIIKYASMVEENKQWQKT